jgi:hypothetical protein
MNKIDINNRYPDKGEIRVDKNPYYDYYKCLISTFGSKINSLCDIGCATGHLIYYVKQNNPTCVVKGYEYFDYHKKSNYCEPLIRDSIQIYDIRDPLPDDVEKYDIVNCSEVGEHIDPLYADILIENAKKLSNKYIIFTWSSHGGDLEPHCDPLHQHLNPLKYDDYIKLMQKHNLKKNTDLTMRFLNHSRQMKDFYFWWRESFVVWEI